MFLEILKGEQAIQGNFLEEIGEFFSQQVLGYLVRGEARHVALSADIFSILGDVHIQERFVSSLVLPAVVAEHWERVLNSMVAFDSNFIFIQRDSESLEFLRLLLLVVLLENSLEESYGLIEMVINDNDLCEGTELRPRHFVQEMRETILIISFLILLFLIACESQLALHR